MSGTSESIWLSSSRGTGRPAGLSWRTPFILACCLLIATTTLLDPLDNLLRVAREVRVVRPWRVEAVRRELDAVGREGALRAHEPREGNPITVLEGAR